MANLIPQNPLDQLGTTVSPWAELHATKARVQGLRLPDITVANPNYSVFNAPNSDYLFAKTDGTLSFGQARIAYYADFSPTMSRLSKFLAQEAGTGVHGEFPHIPQQYDTLYSVAIALQQHDTSIGSLNDRVTALEGGGDDCCDYDLSELSDVTLTTPTDGQALVYEGNLWVNKTLGVAYTKYIPVTAVIVAAKSFTITPPVLLVDNAPRHVLLTVNGVAQAYGTDYTVSDSIVTWGSADFQLELGDVLTFTYTGA